MTFEYFGARFRLFNTSVSQVMFYNPSRWHGARDMCFLRKLVRAGDTIVDIGANVGSHAIPLAKALGTTSPVYAFEPHPRTFAYLQANAALNQLPNLHLYNFALGESEGEVAFTDEKSDDLNRVSTHGSGAIIVPVKPLDSIECLDQAAITLLKVDVEGYELFVLRGASKALQRTEFIFLEANTRHSQEFGTTVRSCRLSARAELDALQSFRPTNLGGVARSAPCGRLGELARDAGCRPAARTVGGTRGSAATGELTLGVDVV
jgi:FkbM family methyltransferase